MDVNRLTQRSQEALAEAQSIATSPDPAAGDVPDGSVIEVDVKNDEIVVGHHVGDVPGAAA